MHARRLHSIVRPLLALACCITAPILFAQNQNTSISGLVKDPGGAVVANANVTLLNIQTGVTLTTKTNNSGLYVVPSILPGQYQVSAEAPGFQKTTVADVTLNAAAPAAVDIQLQLGKSQQTVRVTEQAPLLNTASGTLSSLITAEQVSNLPLSGQNPLTLIGLTAGIVTTSPPAAQTLFDRGATSSVSYFEASGGMKDQNNFSIDGIRNMITNRLGYMPPASDVAQFNILSGGYDAQSEGGSTAIVVITKSGTNNWHGAAYEFFQNDALDANNYFSKRVHVAKPPLRFNQFGVSLGGPILRNRAFFFFNYDGIRRSTSGPVTTTVPTAKERTGDFSSSLDQHGNLIKIYNPFTSRPDPSHPGEFIRDQFPNNIINVPINPAAAGLLTLLPLPNRPGDTVSGANNYSVSVGTRTPMDNYNGRVDYQINSRNRLFGRFSRQSSPDTTDSPFPLIPASSELVHQINTGIGITSILNSSTTLDARLGWMGYLAESATPRQSLENLGFNSAFLNIFGAGQYVPQLSVSNMTSFGNPETSIDHEDTWAMNANLEHLQGRHDLKTGFQAQVRHSNNTKPDPTPTFSFTQAMTQGPNPKTVGSNIGDGIASFLLGAMNSGSIASTTASANTANFYGAYVQDNFRASSKLTLNLGLRWDVWLPATTRRNEMNVDGISPDTPNPIAAAAQANYALHPIPELPPEDFKVNGGLSFATPSNRRWAKTYWNLFSPRIGFAYSLNDKTVIRGGFGMFRSMFWVPFIPQNGFSNTTTVTTSIDGITPFDLLDNPVPNGLDPITGNSLGMLTGVGSSIQYQDPESKPSLNSRWSVGFQRQITPTLSVEAYYVGQKGSNIPVGTPSSETKIQEHFLPAQYLALGSRLFDTVPNPFFGVITSGPLSNPTISVQNLLSTYPQFTSVMNAWTTKGGESYYNGLQATVTKRLSHGLSLLSTYTWSKNINRIFYLNPSDPGPSRMIGEYDAPQRFTLGGSYELPFGPNRRYGWQSGFGSKLIGGWRFSINGVFQSGLPITLSSGVVQTGISPTLSPDKRSVDDWFNKAAFEPLPAFTLRTAPWTLASLRSDATDNWDAAFMKDTKFGDRANLRFQLDAFNTLNRAQFGTPNVNPTSGSYGTITSQSNSPRTLQLGLKLTF